VAFALLGSCASVLAQRPARDPSSGPVVGTAAITGIVLSTDTGTPVRRAQVTVAGTHLPIGRSAITDDSGRFLVEALPAGSYTVSARKAAYLTGVFGATGPERPGVTLAVSDGQRLTDITLHMTRGAAVGGTVVDERGQPLPGAQVSAFRVLPGGLFSATAAAASCDDRGRYRVFGLPPGDYLVSVTFPMPPASGAVDAPTAAEIDAMLAALERGEASRTAQITSTAPSPSGPVTALPVFYPGVFNQGQAIKIRIRPGEDRAGVDMMWRFARAATVAGTVMPYAGDAADVIVLLVPAGPELPIPLVPVVSMRPDAGGRFSFFRVSPGAYTIHARTTRRGRRTAGPGDATTFWARADIDVAAGASLDVALALRPAVSLRGRVTLDVSTLTPPADLTGLRVVASNDTEAALRKRVLQGLAPDTARPECVVAGDGTFILTDLTWGVYEISVSGMPPGWWLRSAIIGAKDVLDWPLEIQSNSTSLPPLVVTLSDHVTVLSGRLQSQEGQTVKGTGSYSVVVFPSDRSLWRMPSRRVQTARVDQDGGFTVRGLPPGGYLVVVVADSDDRDPMIPLSFEHLARTAVSVTLREGDHTRQDLKVLDRWPGSAPCPLS